MALRTRSRRPQAAHPSPTVPQAGRTGRRSGLILSLALVAYAVLALGYAVRTPIWHTPAAPPPLTYARGLAEPRTPPGPRGGDWPPALLRRWKNGPLSPPASIAAIRYGWGHPPLYYLLATPVWVLGPT